MPATGRSLLDTDVLVLHFRGNPHVVARREEYRRSHGKFDLSVVSYYELERGAETNPRKYQLWLRFVGLCHVIELDQAVADTAAHIDKILSLRGDLIVDANRLIAATALTHGLTLVTHNSRHFSRIQGLQIQDWTRSRVAPSIPRACFPCRVGLPSPPFSWRNFWSSTTSRMCITRFAAFSTANRWRC